MEGPVCALVDAMFRLPAKLDRLLASYGHTLPRGAKDEIPLIKQDLEKMVAILQVQEDSGAEDCSMMVKCLTKEVRELSYDMEDSVDQYEHAADSRRGILSPRRKKYKITRRRSMTTSGLREKLKWRLWMANKIREFSVRSQEALQRYSLFNHLGDNSFSAAAIDGTGSSTSPTRDAFFVSWYPTQYGELVGIDEHVNKLQEWLGKDGEQKLKVVSVVGSGGIGKTTLAKELYRRIGGLFDYRAFVRTSRKPDVRRLLISMLSQIKPHHTPHNWKVHSLIADIRTHLQDKRYLIVIDDVWATQTWDIINRALPAGSLCSGILVTTEVDDVALKCCDYDSKYVLTMKPLGQDDSSKLFFSTVFGPQYDCPPELSEVANNIIRKCAGLPLAIVTVASLLANQMGKPEKWDYVNKSLGYGVSTNPSSEGMKQVLNLSYNNLAQRLKACVMYLSIYEGGYIILKDDLVHQWMAESFIRAADEKDMEEISRNCFDELISSRMIQPVHINDNGDVLSCTVHHMVLDFFKHKSLEENFVTAIDHCQTTAWLADKVRRLSLQFGNAEATTPTNMTLSQVRTLAFFGVINCLPSILEFRLLQVLILHLWGDDERISFDLTGMSELFRLRYFHVTCNANLEVSQIQMRGLKYLETLNIDARVSAVPSDIVHLPGLLHLSVPVETNLPNGIGRMTSLCTLGYFDLSINSIDNVQCLGELTNLRYLRLTCSTVPSSHLKSKMDDMGSILAKLSNLRSVTLEPSSILGDGPSSMSISCDGLSSVSSPPALLQRFEWLPCICTFPSIPKWIGHLNKLCTLKIGVRELASNDVDILRGLPALTVLSLYVRLKPSERIVFTKTGFSVLKVFKFRCSVPWLEFEVDAMPNLLKLKLGFDAHGVDQHCTIPAGIVHLIGLKEISAKIGVAGARDPDRRAAESGLIDAIKMHPACPTFNIQCLDGMFGGKDDNSSRVQEEEVEHMTLQKQYDIMEEDSIEQHEIVLSGLHSISSINVVDQHDNQMVDISVGNPTEPAIPAVESIDVMDAELVSPQVSVETDNTYDSNKGISGDVEKHGEVVLSGLHSISSINVVDQHDHQMVDDPVGNPIEPAIPAVESTDVMDTTLSPQVSVEPDNNTYNSNNEGSVVNSSTKRDLLSSWIESIVSEAKKDHQPCKSTLPSISLPVLAPKEDSRRAGLNSVGNPVGKSPQMNCTGSMPPKVAPKQANLPSSSREPPRVSSNPRHKTWHRGDMTIEQHVVLQKDTREDAGSRWEDSAPSSRPCGSIDDQSLGCESGQSFLKFDSHDLLNYTAPCKMPKIKNLFDACKVSFSPDGPISDEALERVRALLDEIRPLDLGLDKEAKIACNWNSSTRQQKGRRARDGPNQYAPPIKYLHIHECESFSMGIFCMPPSSVTPLHNHPAMTVLSKLLYGKLHTESYDWIDVADPADPLKPRPAKCLRDREVSAPETTILYPDRGGNIHTFRAITPCALVDILCPPYSAENGRDCSYFRKSSVKEPSVVLPSDIGSSEIVWLEELEDHQPPEGFVVARSLYKGPAIKGGS